MRRQNNCVSCPEQLRVVSRAPSLWWSAQSALCIRAGLHSQPTRPPAGRATRSVLIVHSVCGSYVWVFMMCGGVSGRRPLRLSRHGPRPLRPWIPPMQFILSFLQHLSRERKTSAVAQSRRTTGAPRRDSGRRECDARRGLGTTHETGGGRGTRPPPQRVRERGPD